MGTQNKAAQQARNTQAANGAKENLKGTIQLAGENLKVADVVETLQAPTLAIAATEKAKNDYQAAIAAERAVTVKARMTRTALQSYLVGIHGADNSILGKFGFTVKKPATKTVEVKAGAVQKMRATRKARGTMGKKQKAKIKGTVEVDAAELAALQTAAQAGSTNATTTTATTRCVTAQRPLYTHYTHT